MNETRARTEPPAAASTTIRAQLIWASLFPLLFFSLLSTLAVSAAFNRMLLDQVTRRNTAQVRALAASLALGAPGAPHPSPEALGQALSSLDPVDGSRLYLIDTRGGLVSSSDATETGLPLEQDALARLVRQDEPASQLMETVPDMDAVMVSFAALPGQDEGILLTEPWAAIRLPSLYYLLILIGLSVLGIAFSLGMLYLSIGRVVHPIAGLAENATQAVPGSVFHPVPLHGPHEIRLLIDAFNQMVIRLAEQQAALRQYAHKALLSQEEERQRLSHELHDGTLQDLLSLSQRVELCRNEVDRDPLQAKNRLDELHRLIEQSIDDVRRISSALRPPVLEDLGLAVALEALGRDLQQDRPDLRYEYILSGEARRLSPDLELAVYRVVQEALANIRKHAPHARRVQVELGFDEDEIRVSVCNDGEGFSNRDVRELVRSGHLGLAGMYERARLFGGSLEITSESGDRTVVCLRCPCFSDPRSPQRNP